MIPPFLTPPSKSDSWAPEGQCPSPTPIASGETLSFALTQLRGWG